MKNAIAVMIVAGILGASLAACKTPMTPRYGTEVSGVRHPGTSAPGRALRADAEVFEAACDIRASVEAFRNALGALNPNQPGSFGSGRREINWDAVPAQFTNNESFPPDFFNQPTPGRARGNVYSTPGSAFSVADDNFERLNPTYADEFEFFSPIKTFIAVGSPVTIVDLFVPGTSTPATSTGFGVVFSDVDHPGSARLRLFDAAGRNLGTYLAPACPGGLSFVGVRFREAIVARVEILSGHAALGSDSFDSSSGHLGPIHDLVIMDDFIYGEPIAIGGETATASNARSIRLPGVAPRSQGGLGRAN